MGYLELWAQHLRLNWPGKVPDFDKELLMKKSALLVALSAASLAGGIAFAQTSQTTKPYGADTKPETTRPASGDPSLSMTQLDKNKDGVVDKDEAKASPSLAAIFDKADTNKDGKLDAGELTAASRIKP
jgi:EF hand